MVYQVKWIDDQPVTIVSVNSTHLYKMDNAFRCVSACQQSDQSFVIYDCSGFDLTFKQLEDWLYIQSIGLRGSITDPSTQTILVGDSNILEGIVYAFEQDEFGGVQVGLHHNMVDAVHHARDGYRIFSAW